MKRYLYVPVNLLLFIMGIAVGAVASILIEGLFESSSPSAKEQRIGYALVTIYVLICLSSNYYLIRKQPISLRIFAMVITVVLCTFAVMMGGLGR